MEFVGEWGGHNYDATADSGENRLLSDHEIDHLFYQYAVNSLTTAETVKCIHRAVQRGL